MCVVLRTYGRNIYPDTTNLFEYVFDNFKKVSVEGLETSEDVGEILTEQEGGYVVLPKGVEFSDLKMEFIPDDANSQERILLENFRNGLLENRLSTACKVQRLSTGTVNVEYKGILIGSFNFRNGNSWMCYLMGTSGKFKKVEGFCIFLENNIGRGGVVHERY